MYFRAFQESTDTAGPQVATGSLPSGTTHRRGMTRSSRPAGLKHIVLSFDKEMYDNVTHTGNAVTNPANYLLLQNGVAVSGNIVRVQYGLNEASELAATDPRTTAT